MKEILKDIIREYQYEKLPEVIFRDIEIPLNLNKIISIIGARRSGKTYVLYQTILNLLKSGITKEQILFINFEDERLSLNAKNLDQILQAYQELYPDTNLRDVYFFFDEIQNINGWQKFVRRVFDTKSRHLYITGSNSKLLSTDIATELRGRTIPFKVFPLSFFELLKHKNINTTIKTQQDKNRIIHHARKYLFHGGFPEIVNIDNDKIRQKILQEYFNVMIFRDIIERYKISNPEMLKFFIKKIFASVTKPFSVNKAYNDIKSLGYKVSNNYLYQYQDICDAIFLTQSVSKFDYSEIKQAKSDKKTYIIDTGLLSAIEFSVSKNIGKLFENAVCMEFKKKEIPVFYYRDNYECDFIIEENKSYTPVQVSYSIENDETKKRELRGIYEACTYLNITHGTIITFEQEERINYKGIDIDIIPFYKYFLP